MQVLVLPVPVAIATSMLALARGDAVFDRADGGELVVAERQVVGGLVRRASGLRRGRVLCEQCLEPVRRVPPFKRAAGGSSACGRRETRCRSWCRVGAGKGRPLVEKQNGMWYLPHGPPGELIVASHGSKSAAVPLGLLDRAGHVLVHLLRLDGGDGRQPDEQHVVGRAARRSATRRLRGSCPSAGARPVECGAFGVGLPSGVAELLVDLPAGRGLVQVDQSCCLAAYGRGRPQPLRTVSGCRVLNVAQLLVERLSLGR